MANWKYRCHIIATAILFALNSSMLPVFAQATKATTNPTPSLYVPIHSNHANHSSYTGHATWNSGVSQIHTNSFSHTFNNWQNLNSTLHSPINLNLSSTSAALSAPRIVNYRPVDITLGSGNSGIQLQITSSTLLTPAEQLALTEVLRGGIQTLVLNAQGQAIGGSFVISPRLSQSIATLVIPQGVTALDNVGRSGVLTLTGSLTNAGTLDIYSRNPLLTTLSITANSINNSGIISTLAPQGIGNTISGLNLQLNSANNISNSGTIQSNGSIGLSAGSGTFNNSGLISSKNGSINFNTPSPVDIVINNAGGTLQAFNGNVNVRNASFTANNNLTFNGGNVLSKELNLYTGGGKLVANFDTVSGQVNGVAGSAEIGAVSSLNLGNLILTGDPDFYSLGSLIESGDLNYTGQDLGLYAQADIDMASGSIEANNLTMDAGVQINATTNSDGSITYALTGQPSVSGGSINLGSTNINATSVTMWAANNVTNAGVIESSSSIGIIAGGNITNASGTSTPAILQAATGINLSAVGGTTNSGVISVYNQTATTSGLSVSGDLTNSSAGYILIGNAAPTNGLNVTGTLTNAGILDIYSSNSSIAGATISANNIINQMGGTITSAVPSGITNGISNIYFQITSTNNISNAGTIQSTGTLGLTAGGTDGLTYDSTITNALPSGYTTGSTGITPTIQAANGINFSSTGGTFNSGSISVYNNVVSLGSGATTSGINVTGDFTNNSTGTVLIGNASSATSVLPVPSTNPLATTPNATSGMNVTGTFTNAGTVDLFSTIAYITTGTVSAGSIVNQSGGSIISSTPTGLSNYLFDMGLQINSASNINNAGTIMAPNGINLSAPDGINNSGLVYVNVSTTAFYNNSVTTSGVNVTGDLINTSAGSILVSNPNSTSGLVVTGDLYNSGVIDFYATNQPGTSPLVSANTITNNTGGIITSVAPTGVVGALPSVNIQLNSAGYIYNAGVIQSTGSLGLTAGGAINNVLPAGSTSATSVPYIQAVNGINLSSVFGISNNGVISIYSSNSYNPNSTSNGINVTGDITNNAAGQIFVQNANGNNSLNVTGTLTNSGVVDVYSTTGYVTNATITANSINNQSSGIISSVAPSGTVNAVSNLNMQINSTNDINNAGTIQSGGTLGLTAGSGNFNNSGLLNSVNGNINFNAPTANAVDITINNNGTVQAQNGDINIRTASYSGNNNVNVTGGNFYSNNFNAYSGQGAVNMNVNNVNGTMNISSGSAQIYSGGLLNIGNINVTGNFEASSPDSMYLRLPNYSTSCFCYTLAGNLVILPGSNIQAGEVVLYLGGSFLMTGGSITAPVIGVEAGIGNGGYGDPNSTGGSIKLIGTIITSSDYALFSDTSPGTTGSIVIGGVNGLQANVSFTNASYTWGYSWGLQFGTSYVLFGPNSSVTNTPNNAAGGSSGGTTAPSTGAGNPNSSPSGSNAYNGANYNGTVSSAMNAYNAANYSSATANSPSATNSTDQTLSGQMGELTSYNSNANGPDLASYNSDADGPGLASYNSDADGSELASYNSHVNGASLGSYSLAANTVSAANAASTLENAFSSAANAAALDAHEYVINAPSGLQVADQMMMAINGNANLTPGDFNEPSTQVSATPFSAYGNYSSPTYAYQDLDTGNGGASSEPQGINVLQGDDANSNSAFYQPSQAQAQAQQAQIEAQAQIAQANEEYLASPEGIHAQNAANVANGVPGDYGYNGETITMNDPSNGGINTATSTNSQYQVPLMGGLPTPAQLAQSTADANAAVQGIISFQANLGDTTAIAQSDTTNPLINNSSNLVSGATNEGTQFMQSFTQPFQTVASSVLENLYAPVEFGTGIGQGLAVQDNSIPGAASNSFIQEVGVGVGQNISTLINQGPTAAFQSAYTPAVVSTISGAPTNIADMVTNAGVTWAGMTNDQKQTAEINFFQNDVSNFGLQTLGAAGAGVILDNVPSPFTKSPVTTVAASELGNTSGVTEVTPNGASLVNPNATVTMFSGNTTFILVDTAGPGEAVIPVEQMNLTTSSSTMGTGGGEYSGFNVIPESANSTQNIASLGPVSTTVSGLVNSSSNLGNPESASANVGNDGVVANAEQPIISSVPSVQVSSPIEDIAPNVTPSSQLIPANSAESVPQIATNTGSGLSPNAGSNALSTFSTTFNNATASGQSISDAASAAAQAQANSLTNSIATALGLAPNSPEVEAATNTFTNAYQQAQAEGQSPKDALQIANNAITGNTTNADVPSTSSTANISAVVSNVPAIEPTAPTTAIEPTTPTTAIEPTAPTTAIEPTAPTTAIEPTVPTTAIEPTAPTTVSEPQTIAKSPTTSVAVAEPIPAVADDVPSWLNKNIFEPGQSTAPLELPTALGNLSDSGANVLENVLQIQQTSGTGVVTKIPLYQPEVLASYANEMEPLLNMTSKNPADRFAALKSGIENFLNAGEFNGIPVQIELRSGKGMGATADGIPAAAQFTHGGTLAFDSHFVSNETPKAIAAAGIHEVGHAVDELHAALATGVEIGKNQPSLIAQLLNGQSSPLASAIIDNLNNKVGRAMFSDVNWMGNLISSDKSINLIQTAINNPNSASNLVIARGNYVIESLINIEKNAPILSTMLQEAINQRIAAPTLGLKRAYGTQMFQLQQQQYMTPLEVGTHYLEQTSLKYLDQPKSSNPVGLPSPSAVSPASASIH